jgi:chemotaxis protein methyltransferase CheR
VTAPTGQAEAALSRASRLELSAFRREHLERRTRIAVAREDVADETQLARLLSRDVAARGRFRAAVAVSVTGVFRDPAQFELLERTLLPPLLARRSRLWVWSAGCADGSELYSLALMLERLGALERSVLLGSDLLEENIVRARRGEWSGEPASALIRSRLRWEQRDIVAQGPPQGRWHLVLCRNLAIYLRREAKDALHASLAAALAPGGVLLLGRSERLGDAAALGLDQVAPHAYRRRK